MAEHDLDDARAALRRLGYLSHGVERFLLQDVLRPHPPLRTALALAARVGLLAGVVLALALAYGLAAANGNLAASPLDLVPLFLHLFPPLAVTTGVAFLGLCAVLAVALRWQPPGGIEGLSLGIALAAGAATAGLALWQTRLLIATSPAWQLAVLVVVAPLAAYALVRVLYNGLLGLAIRLTDLPPQRLVSRRWVWTVLAGGALLFLLPVGLAARRAPQRAPSSMPTAPGERVLVVGVDGVLPEEFDYLLAHGDLPELARLGASGGRVAGYRRPEEPPAAFWTSVATGLPSPEHGVASLDSFRPLGVTTPLARSGPLRAYWVRCEMPLGLAEYRPVLSNHRRAFTFWELAARGGAPVVAVDWWGTFPADQLPGLVVAHGAYQLLAESAAGAVAPATQQAAAEALRLAMDAGPLRTALAAALPPPAAEAALRKALLPDRFYLELLRRQLAGSPRAAALYLPGLDIAADGWGGGDVAFADLVRRQLADVDRLIAGGVAGVGTVALVLDPGRRGGGEGRILVWRSAGCQPNREGAPLAPEALASGLLRALGLPQSEELPAPPAGCNWDAPPAVVATYGERAGARPSATSSEEYLQNLKSLGYL